MIKCSHKQCHGVILCGIKRGLCIIITITMMVMILSLEAWANMSAQEDRYRPIHYYGGTAGTSNSGNPYYVGNAGESSNYGNSGGTSNVHNSSYKNNSNSGNKQKKNYQAKIGSKMYMTVQDAVRDVREGQTIKLIKNVKLNQNETIHLNRNVKYTLDMCGKTITRKKVKKDNYVYLWMSRGQVTVKNGTIKASANVGPGMVLQGKTSITLKGVFFINGYINIREKAKLIMDRSSLTCKICSIFQNGGTVIINGGTIESEGSCIDLSGGKTVINNGKLSGNVWISNNASLEIKKCEFKSMRTGIFVSGTSSVKIFGGTFTAVEDVVYCLSHLANLMISGGTFRSIGNWRAIYTKATTNISGGEFTTGDNSVVYDESESKLTISGGQFTNNSQMWPTINSVHHVKEINGAAVINQGNSNLTLLNVERQY